MQALNSFLAEARAETSSEQQYRSLEEVSSPVKHTVARVGVHTSFTAPLVQYVTLLLAAGEQESTAAQVLTSVSRAQKIFRNLWVS